MSTLTQYVARRKALHWLFLGAWEEEGEWKLIKKIDNNQNKTCTQKCFLRFMHQMWNWYFLTLLTLNSDEFIVN